MRREAADLSPESFKIKVTSHLLVLDQGSNIRARKEKNRCPHLALSTLWFNIDFCSRRPDSRSRETQCSFALVA